MAPEGRIILYPLLSLAVVATAGLIWAPQVWLKSLTGLMWLLVAFSLQFFRDPQRGLPEDPRAFISPADGRVVAIKAIGYHDDLQAEALQISIFLSIFNVHAQWVPIDAHVEETRYHRGKFLAAFNHRASDENEQGVTLFTSEGGKFMVKQITGAIARRILSYMRPGEDVHRGDRLGYIRFGSRVDIILPADFQVRVKVGDKVRGTTSIIGTFAS